MKVSIRRGLPIAIAGAPVQRIEPSNPVERVGMLGADLPGLRPEFLVQTGDAVALGAPVFRDRKRPDIIFTAPAAGTVEDIVFGAKRRLSSLSIAVSGEESVRFSIPEAPGREQAEELLLASGLWSAFKGRPFGRIPDPGTAPDALFVTAIDTAPHAADPKVVIKAQGDRFARGVDFLGLLTDGPVFVCQAPGENLVREDAHIRCVQFSGYHPAGLAGTHIDKLFPLSEQRRVWQISYQDVLALGHLLEHGTLPGERVISLAGPGVRKPRLMSVPPGAELGALIAGEVEEGAKTVLSGSALAGRQGRFLGRFHWQVSVLPKPPEGPQRRWLNIGKRTTKPRPVIPHAVLDHALGPDIPAMPLIRALSVGDAETAHQLGCLALLEEDMALLTYATGGAQNFGALLRPVLDVLEEAL